MRFLAFIVVVSSAASATAAEPAKKIDFSHDVAPLIKKHCGKCHTGEKREGSFSLNTREELLKSQTVVPGNAAESELYRRLVSDDADERMPAKVEPLPAEAVALVRAWIDEGLAWEPGFSFAGQRHTPPLRLRAVELPPVREGATHPIDRLVYAYFAKRRIAPPPATDDAAFARRTSLDAVGLLPASSELAEFLADSSGDKRERWVRRLLGDRRGYADHWLSFFNDLLRNDYRGTGYIDGGRQQISKWLYQSLVDNKPYDQFARELIAPNDAAAGFIQGIKWRGRVNASQTVEIQFSQNVSQVFFGINMKCASCHDSFIDTWKLDDAYALAAVVAERPLEIHRCDKATGRLAQPRFLWPELGEINASLDRAGRLKQLAVLMTRPENGRFARTISNRLWHRLLGRGLAHPVDVMANPPWNDDLLDYLANYLVEQHYDLKRWLEHVLTSRTYQAECVMTPSGASGDDYVFRGPEVKRMSAEQYLDAIWQITGASPDKPIAPVALADFAADTPDRRRFIRVSLVFCDELMRSLGRPNREQVVTTRGDALTTLQALDLSNGPLLAQTLSRGAASLLRGAAGPEQIIKSLYMEALSRAPSADEQATAADLLGSPPTHAGLADLLWAVFMLPEFQLIH